MTKRYMLFAGAGYYPSGGMYDFVGFVDSLDLETALEKMKSLKPHHLDWAHIYDVEGGVTVDISYKDLADKGLNNGLYQR